MDWLFAALLRSVSPAELAEPAPFPSHDGAGEIRVPVLTLAPRPALDLVCDPWLSEQLAYHQRSASTHEAMDRRAERAAAGHGLHGFTPWLLLLAAVLPAAVAALNGVRFQSEAVRLADRSQALVQVLSGRRTEALALASRIDQVQANPAADPGAWSLDSLRLAERVADDCVREVAEWTVFYAKELPET